MTLWNSIGFRPRKEWMKFTWDDDHYHLRLLHLFIQILLEYESIIYHQIC